MSLADTITLLAPTPTQGPATMDIPNAAEASSNPRQSGKKSTMNEHERKATLEADKWASNVTPTSVKCVACSQTISLDKRSRYYPGLWLKHCKKCADLKRLQAERSPQVYCTILNSLSPLCDCDAPDEIFISSVGLVTCDKAQILSAMAGLTDVWPPMVWKYMGI
jgi:hypothetical protein